jgi:hypothetical protein
VDISQDVTFDENATFSKYKHICVEEAHEEDNEVPKVLDAVELEEVILEDHDMVEPPKPAEIPSCKRIRAWEQDLISYA